VSKTRPGRSWIGTSGYAYPAWRGPFYPPALAAREHLVFASRRFQSIEINRSFYALLSPGACRAWYEQTPEDFVFALKGSRFITHIKKLRDPQQALANFFASGPLVLQEKLGPIVWQLPAATRFDAERLAAFLGELPRTTTEAAALAQGHDARLKHGAHVQSPVRRALRHVLEPRHTSFLHPECTALLRELGVALAVTDSPAWPSAEEPTADFMYLRLHGSETLYTSAYHERELVRWARHVKAYRLGVVPRDARRVDGGQVARVPRDVYVYFDNDAQAHAPRDAQRLIELVASPAPRAPMQPSEERHATQAARNADCG
jgi:uncharacterized protein YecE (DUF72 family)